MYIMKLNELPFNQIKSGNKVYEIRLNDEKRKQIVVGDTILFKKQPELMEGIVCRVVDVMKFDSFRSMASALDSEGLGFEKGATVDDVEKCYYTYYSQEEEKQYGVVAFRIELV